MPLVRIQKKGQLTLPARIRTQLGLEEGDFVDVQLRSSGIVLTPQLVIDRSKFPSAAGDYTPAQRTAIDKRLDAAEAENPIGPFRNAAAIEALLKKHTRRPLKKAR